jgi:hypothetical protein
MMTEIPRPTVEQPGAVPAPAPAPPELSWRLDPEVSRRMREAVLSDPADAKLDLRCLEPDDEDGTRKTRHDGWTRDRQRRFVESLAQSGVVIQACDDVGLSRQSAYYFRQTANGRAFAALWDEARKIARRALLDNLISNAVTGETLNIREDGFVVAATRRKSPLRLVRMIERIRSETMLGHPRAMAASRDFQTCLEMLEDGKVFADRLHKPIRMPALLPPVPVDLDNPQPSLAYRRWTPWHQRRFCEALSQGGTVDKACKFAGRNRTGAYNLRNRAEGQAFALAWDAALLVYSNEMIDTAHDLACEGATAEIARKGKVTRWHHKDSPDVAAKVIQRLDALKAREDKLYGDGFDQIGCAKDFGAALDLLESGAALKAIQARERSKRRR